MWEFKEAVQTAVDRMAVSKSNGYKSRFQTSDYQRWLWHEVCATAAEKATAKLLNVHWSASVNTFHTYPDVLPNLEVRQTDYKHGRLIVRPDDPDDRFYILVTGVPPTLTVHGYISAKAAKQDDYWGNPDKPDEKPDAWWVPQADLKPLDVPKTIEEGV
jgi:hypothetical protein